MAAAATHCPTPDTHPSAKPLRSAPPWATQAACAALLAVLAGLGVGSPTVQAPSQGLWPAAGMALGLLLLWRQWA